MRMTKSHVEAKVNIVNGMLGFDPELVSWNTIGALHLYGAYGGYAIHRVSNEYAGVSDLSGGIGTLRDCERFLSGMIAALRITREA